jgi:hypothetical protein
MARTIELAFAGATAKCAIDKVDRTSLYGSVTTETHDVDGKACRLATLAGDGKTLIPSGDTALAYMTDDGRWMERNMLVPVDAAGNRVNSVASSFTHPLELEVTATPTRFLDHSIRSAYMLSPEATLPEKLDAALRDGAIFKTDFSYRGGISADPAFVMKSADGTLWLLVGDENDVSFVGFNQTAGLAAEDAEDPADDDLDFDMM